MNEIEIILVGCIGLIAVYIIIAYWWKKKEQTRKKIDAQVDRVRRANEPGYRPPGSGSMRTTIKDGVITYKKDKSQKKEKDESGR